MIRSTRLTMILFALIFLTLPTVFANVKPDEGMYPLNRLGSVDLRKAGLKISPEELYNPNGISLIDALVRVGGCTGSFVSPDGLIITNHHCVFGAVQTVSSAEQDYITNGFLADQRIKEIPAIGLNVRITESYRDVSDIIVSEAAKVSDLADRGKIISQTIANLIEEEKKSYPGYLLEVSEMFTGKSYILFRYREIRDVRLVYVPPRSIGEFGGESDNWVWPRHTGDFSFVRAYVAPDGSPSTYSEKNIPYTPKKHLKINPKGVNENDFVFILGYPGRTFRHQPSQFVEYHETFELPYVQELYDWIISRIDVFGKNNKEHEIRLSDFKKSLANRAKNYRGKRQGMYRLDLVAQRKKNDDALAAFIKNNPELNAKYGHVLKSIDGIYIEKFSVAQRELWFENINRTTSLIAIANRVGILSEQLQLPEDQRTKDYQKDQLNRWKNAYRNYYKDVVPDFDADILTRMLEDAAKFPSDQRIVAVDNLLKSKPADGSIADFTKQLVNNSKLTQDVYFQSLFELTADEWKKFSDPLVRFSRELAKENESYSATRNRWNGSLNKYLSELVEVRQIWQQADFIPDANSTLRLTFGYIKSYAPADAVRFNPITTLNGLLEKSKMGEDYELPEDLRHLILSKDYGSFAHPTMGSVPVGILYNMDTTGGNSGSPIMDAYGNLVGVNFDRAYEATINDYAWSESYSRSIGVDIRYVLWIVQKYAKADFLLNEMGVKI